MNGQNVQIESNPIHLYSSYKNEIWYILNLFLQSNLVVVTRVCQPCTVNMHCIDHGDLLQNSFFPSRI